MDTAAIFNIGVTSSIGKWDFYHFYRNVLLRLLYFSFSKRPSNLLLAEDLLTDPDYKFEAKNSVS